MEGMVCPHQVLGTPALCPVRTCPSTKGLSGQAEEPQEGQGRDSYALWGLGQEGLE